MNGWRDRRPTLDVLGRVGDERDRQERLVLVGKFSQTCADPEMPTDLKLACLGEEFGEVCRALLGEGDLRTELVEVAAVAVAWAESLGAVSGEGVNEPGDTRCDEHQPPNTPAKGAAADALPGSLTPSAVSGEAQT